MFVLIVFTLIPRDPLDGLVRDLPSLATARRSFEIAKDWRKLVNDASPLLAIDATYRVFTWGYLRDAKNRLSPLKERLRAYTQLKEWIDRYNQRFGRGTR